MLLVNFFSGSKSFKKKFKGKGDDIKLKVKPKKFSKDFKGDASLGQKRKANNVDDHKQKKFKAKKWKGEQESPDGKKGQPKQKYENKKSDKHFQKNDKESQSRTGKGKFDGGKAMKRKLSDGSGSKDFVKKKKLSGPGEHNKGNVSVIHKINLWISHTALPEIQNMGAVYVRKCLKKAASRNL